VPLLVSPTTVPSWTIRSSPWCFQTVREIVADANDLLVDFMETGRIAAPDEDNPTFR
jgi:hypothetical protein